MLVNMKQWARSSQRGPMPLLMRLPMQQLHPKNSASCGGLSYQIW